MNNLQRHLKARKNLPGYELFKKFQEKYFTGEFVEVPRDEIAKDLAYCISVGMDNELLGMLLKEMFTSNEELHFWFMDCLKTGGPIYVYDGK